VSRFGRNDDFEIWLEDHGNCNDKSRSPLGDESKKRQQKATAKAKNRQPQKQRQIQGFFASLRNDNFLSSLV
jgi:hypothetical protein